MVINYEEYELNRRQKYVFNGLFLLSSLIVSFLLYHNLFFSLLALIIYKYAKNRYKKYLKIERITRLTEQFKDLLFALSTELCTGSSMREAMGKSKDKMIEIYGEKSVIYIEVKNMYKRMINEDDIDVLKDFADRSTIDDIRDFVMIYATCKYTGANMILAMDKATSVIIDKMTIEKEITELVKRKKSEGVIILIMPAIIILFLNVTAADYIGVLYESVKGRILMTGVVFAYIGIFKLIEDITRIKV